MERKLLRYGILSIAFLTVPIVFIHLVSSQFIPKEYREEWPAVKETAELVTIGYFKKTKHLDIVIEKIESPKEYRTHEVYLSGHVVDDKQRKISAILNFSENYSIRDTSKDLF
ncbi:phosphoglycolate phosphatase [Bacillus thuringiensis]|uniref:phosphoglycolate phosphatase n=1 Tax=Bacillus thuringiensis TaxID=1428 RepID=UPI000BF58C02|nr:phosphoglycolate phosphatase [Bacillus thuringiensis]PFQ70949.1 phosphoglycolate phosphatase [Bacillus thuringiensis]PGK75926.1 phosphoglycolate phosphatase [Bacillus thuringiensis]PGM26961.1 phosphoglycolate phosphatase [Bacillus thuringiensis]PGP90302.1 phosphoglycolate phosphatase [Bacillus thuringiensis]PGR64450.1 phosphoglycolate phosphatase [Bacillus thuringiensis]